MPRTSHPPQLYYSNTWRRIQIMKIFVNQFIYTTGFKFVSNFCSRILFCADKSKPGYFPIRRIPFYTCLYIVLWHHHEHSPYNILTLAFSEWKILHEFHTNANNGIPQSREAELVLCQGSLLVFGYHVTMLPSFSGFPPPPLCLCSWRLILSALHKTPVQRQHNPTWPSLEH
jgi:hypothetical protein